MKPLSIEDRIVGPGRPVMVITELGVNHDGSVRRALELVSAAASCGADAVKLQIFHARTLMHESASLAKYQKQRAGAKSAAEMLCKYELSAGQVRRIVRRIRELGMIPLATPFSPDDLRLIESLDLPAVKIASPDLVNRPLLERTARLAKPLLLSTGAATMPEIKTTAGWLRRWKSPFALLHCISAYPVPDAQANLCWIRELSEHLDVPVGYSDHTTSHLSGALAVASGACIIEKHLTYDRRARGPDHAASSDPAQFKRYVKLVRQAQALHGLPGKQVLPIEQEVRRISRQSLVARRGLAAGQVLRAADLTVQRPGTGVPAAMISRAIGRKLGRPIAAGTMLHWDMLRDAA